MRQHHTPDALHPRRSIRQRQRRLFYGVVLGMSLGMSWGTVAMPGVGLTQEEPSPVQIPATKLEQDFDFLREFPAWRQLNSTFFQQIDLNGLIDQQTVSDTTLTLPSLWWNRDHVATQLGGNRLVRGWLAYHIPAPDLRVVDLVISSQYWAVLNYPERYAVLNQFGTAAKQFGYNLRVFQGNYLSSRLVGLYVCDFAAGAMLTPSLAPSAESLPINAPINAIAIDVPQATIPCQASLDLFTLEGYRGSNNNSPFMGTPDDSP